MPKTIARFASHRRSLGRASIIGLLALSACIPPAAATPERSPAPAGAVAARVPVSSASSAVREPKAAPAKPTLLIYGDSLTVLSEGAVGLLYGAQYQLVFRAYGGTSICDWTTHAVQDRADYHPSRVVIAFTGNSASCSGPDLIRGGVTAWLANYQRSLLSMRRVFSGLPISVVGSPAVLRPQPPGSWFPTNGSPLLNQMYRQMCARHGMHYDASADNDLTPGHVFEWQRPAFPGNGPETVVRLSDGVHVTPAGALYYAAALGGS